MMMRSFVVRMVPVLLAVLGVSWCASAQTLSGPFIGFGPNTAGVAVIPSGGTTFIDVDDDGNILTAPVRYDLGALAPDLVGRTEYFLSPSRTILYVVQDRSAMALPAQAWFARLDGAGTGFTILHGPVELGTPTPASRLLFGPAYYDAPGGQQIAYCIVGTTNGFDLELLLIDMNTPGLGGQVRIGLRNAWQNVLQPYSPAGDFMVVQSDVIDGDLDGNTDFVVVGLCGAQFGANSVVERPSGTSSSFSIGNVGSGTADVLISEGGSVVTGVTFNDCFADPDVPPPARGACCVFTGTTLFTCFDDVTSSECSNFVSFGGPFWVDFSPNMLCEDACPVAQLEVSASAADSVAAPGEWTIRYDIDNTSGGDALSVQLQSDVPTLTTFVSATDGGTISGSQVTWTGLGPIPAGTSRTVFMTVAVDCTDVGRLLSLSGPSYEVLFDGRLVRGLTDVTAAVTGPSVAPVTITVNSVPDRVPLLEGDRVHHTITLASPDGLLRSDMLVNSNGLLIGAGRDSVIDQVLDAGGGTFLNNFDSAFSWEGSIPAGGTVTIEFVTLVNCVGGNGDYQLGFGDPITVQNACRTTVGTAMASGPFPILAPLTGSISIVNPQPGRIGPVASLAGSLFSSGNGQLIRNNASVEIEFVVTNAQPEALPMVSATAMLPDALVVGDPPFLGVIPSGFGWDNATRTLSFSGPLAVGASARATVAAVVSPVELCGATVISTVLETGAGCTSGFATLHVWPIPEPPATDRLYAADPFFDGITLIGFEDGAQTTVLERFFCTTPEVYTGLAVTANGTLFVSGLPAWELNPESLEFRLLGADAFNPGLPDPSAWPGPEQVVHAPGTDRVFFTGAGTALSGDVVVAIEPGQAASSAYSDPMTVRVTPEVGVTGDGDLVSVVDGGTNLLVLPTGTGLPAPAGAGTTIPVPAIAYPAFASLGPITAQTWSSVGNGPDGSVVATVVTTFDVFPVASAVDALVRVNVDGSVDVLEPLWAGAQFASAPPFPAGTVFVTPARGFLNFTPGGDGRLYFDSFGTGLMQYDPATGLTLPVLGAGNDAGIAYQSLGSCLPDVDGDGTVDVLDLLAYLASWFALESEAELTGDGLVDVLDLLLFLGAWFPAQGVGNC